MRRFYPMLVVWLCLVPFTTVGLIALVFEKSVVVNQPMLIRQANASWETMVPPLLLAHHAAATADIVDVGGSPITTTVAGVLRVDVTHWGGVAIATARPQVDVVEWLGSAVAGTISGKPDVNIEGIGGNAGAAGSLEDAYDGVTGWAFTGSTMPNVTTVNGLAANVITASSIDANAIDAASIAANAIDASAIAPGAIDADAIAANAIGFSEIADNAIDSGAIAIDAIGSAQIATNAIGALELAADCIGFDEISSSAIGADELGTGAIDADAFAANAITAAAIAADAIGADEIATNAIGTLELAANCIGSAELATGCIGSLELHATAVDKIVVDVKTELDTHGAGSWVDTGGGDATAASQTTIIDHLTDVKGGTWAATDSLEAIRNQGDAAWTTADVSSLATTSQLNARTLVAADYFLFATDTVVNVGTTAAIGSNGITTASFQVGAINASAIATSAIGSAELATGAITSSTYNANALDAIADATWEEAIAGHTTGTTFGGKNQIGVPSATLGDYKADVSNLDATVSSRSSHSAANVYSQIVDGSGRVDVGQFLGTVLDADYPANVNVFFGVNPTTTKTVNDVGTAAGTMDANLIQINGTSIAGTGSQVADRWLGFWNQASAGYSVATALSSFKATGFSTFDETTDPVIVGSFSAGALTNAAFGVGAIDASALATSAADEIATQTWVAGSRELSTPNNYKADVTNLDAAISTVATPAQVATALTNINLDHLVFTATTIPAVTAGTYLDQIMDNGTAVYDRTTDSLQAIADNEQGTDGAYTGTPPTVVQIRQEMDSNSVDLNAILLDTNELQLDDVPGLIAALKDFDPAVDTVANVTTTGNVSGSVTGSVGSISSITFPTNFGDLAITVTTGKMTVGTNDDKTGYTVSGTITTLDALDTALDSAHGAGSWLTGSGTSTLTTGQVGTEVDNALIDINLDHLLKTAVANNADMTVEVTDGTVISNILSATSDTSTYTVADDSLEAISGTAGGTTAPNLLLTTTVNVVDSQTQITLVAGSDQDDAYSGAIVILEDGSNSDFPSIRTVTDYVGSTKTLVIDAAPGFTTDMIAGDGVRIFIAERTLDQAAAVDGKTMRQALRYLAAILAGETSGAGSGTEVFKGLDGLTSRVQVIIDGNGDRTTITYDP